MTAECPECGSMDLDLSATTAGLECQECGALIEFDDVFN